MGNQKGAISHLRVADDRDVVPLAQHRVICPYGGAPTREPRVVQPADGGLMRVVIPQIAA